jgi:hypothetical protein
MTISSETRTAGPFTGNGATSAFPFTFKVFSTSDVLAVRTIDGEEDTLVLNTDYTVSLNADQDTSPGGTLTTLVPLPTDYLLTLTSNVGNTQAVEITNKGGFYPSVINTALDRLTIMVQQLLNKITRSIKIPLSDGVLTTELPTAALRANKALVFDADGNVGVSEDDYTDQATTAASSAAAAAVSAASAATSATSASSSATSSSTSATSAAASAAAAADAVSGFAGDITADVFNGTGAQTAFTLSVTPASKNSTNVFISGVYQKKSTYSLSGTTLTFGSAPASGTANVEVISGRLAPIATPGDLTVSTGKIQDNAVTTAKILDSNVTTAKVADDAITYAKIQNVSATSRILGRKTAAAGDTEECTLSEVLDFIGSAAQGDILYRGASAWARLGAGTSGQFMKTSGAGANPAWSDLTVASTSTAGVSELATTAETQTGTDSARVAPVSAMQYHQGVAKAWVNFNGTGTIAINDSRNVTSLTDNGTGDYTVNLSITMGNSNFSVTHGGRRSSGASHDGQMQSWAASTTTARVTTTDGSTTAVDWDIVCITIMGDLP